jgi:hypothetical protein
LQIKVQKLIDIRKTLPRTGIILNRSILSVGWLKYFFF